MKRLPKKFIDIIDRYELAIEDLQATIDMQCDPTQIKDNFIIAAKERLIAKRELVNEIRKLL